MLICVVHEIFQWADESCALNDGWLFGPNTPSFKNMVTFPPGMLDPCTRKKKLPKINLNDKHPRTFTRHEVQKYVRLIAKQVNHVPAGKTVTKEQDTSDILNKGIVYFCAQMLDIIYVALEKLKSIYCDVAVTYLLQHPTADLTKTGMYILKYVCSFF